MVTYIFIGNDYIYKYLNLRQPRYIEIYTVGKADTSTRSRVLSRRDIYFNKELGIEEEGQILQQGAVLIRRGRYFNKELSIGQERQILQQGAGY